jgi:hypothetical protein
MDESSFEKIIKNLQIHPVIFDSDSPKFSTYDLVTMTRNQLSKLTLEMIKFTGPGSYLTSPELFDLINHLDKIIEIPEDPYLENHLHLTASLICLTQFQWRTSRVPSIPDRLAKHLERIIGSSPFKGIEQGKLYLDFNKLHLVFRLRRFWHIPCLKAW